VNERVRRAWEQVVDVWGYVMQKKVSELVENDGFEIYMMFFKFIINK
jgi:hypothetical protein